MCLRFTLIWELLTEMIAVGLLVVEQLHERLAVVNRRAAVIRMEGRPFIEVLDLFTFKLV